MWIMAAAPKAITDLCEPKTGSQSSDSLSDSGMADGGWWIPEQPIFSPCG